MRPLSPSSVAFLLCLLLCILPLQEGCKTEATAARPTVQADVVKGELQDRAAPSCKGRGKTLLNRKDSNVRTPRNHNSRTNSAIAPRTHEEGFRFWDQKTASLAPAS
jgi:hypothetical protein